MQKLIKTFKNSDFNIQIKLEEPFTLTGLDDNIPTLVNNEISNNINPTIDNELFKFKPSNNITYNFEFYSGTTYVNNYLGAGFTSNEINNLNLSYLKSFFLFIAYDNFDSQNQTKLSTNYKNIKPEQKSVVSSFTGNSNTEFTSIYIPKFYTGNTIYIKLLYYNAKLGKYQQFYNNNLSGSTTEEKLYFKINLNQIANTYTFQDGNNIIGKEINNPSFIENLNSNNGESENVEMLNYNEGSILGIDGKIN